MRNLGMDIPVTVLVQPPGDVEILKSPSPGFSLNGDPRRLQGQFQYPDDMRVRAT